MTTEREAEVDRLAMAIINRERWKQAAREAKKRKKAPEPRESALDPSRKPE